VRQEGFSSDARPPALAAFAAFDLSHRPM
jgi:hypothetical protein